MIMRQTETESSMSNKAPRYVLLRDIPHRFESFSAISGELSRQPHWADCPNVCVNDDEGVACSKANSRSLPSFVH
jgi:hypothetical protein